MTKLIAISGKRGAGLFVAVDDDDFDFLSRWRWNMNNKGYAVRNQTCRRIGQKTKYSVIQMARLVAIRMGLEIDGMEVDHEDRNPLNNTHSNLRLATRTQNAWNTKRKVGSTKLAGVRQRDGKFYSIIRVGRKDHRRLWLGTFVTAEEAHEAYIKATNERSEFSVFAEQERAGAEKRLASQVHRAIVEGAGV